MGSDGGLALLAEHNAWANALVFAACRAIPEDRLAQAGEGYDSVLGMLRHLVQVEHSFFELAHGRAASRVEQKSLAELAARCAGLDESYVPYARTLESDGASGSFLVPWFGFEVSRVEGFLQPLTHSHKHRSDVSMLLPRLGGEGVQMDLIQYLDTLRGSPD